MEGFKAIVAECLYRNVQRDRPLQVAKAKRAVADFCKAVAEPAAHAYLMLFFLEQGNAFRLQFGEIDTCFYSSLVAMASRAAEAVGCLPVDLQKPFREGLGYHDDLTGIYAAAFPDRR